MKPLKTMRVFAAAGLFAGLLFILLLAACARTDRPVKYPVLGHDPISGIIELEDHSEALVSWAAAGYRGLTVVHVGAYDDLAFIPEGKVERLRELVVRRGKIDLHAYRDLPHETLVLHSGYLYAAARLEIVKEIYWVVPYPLFDGAGIGPAIKAFLRERGSGFPEKEIEGLTVQAGCATGPLHGIPVHICSPETLPYIREPVALDIDMSFFPPYGWTRGVSPLRGLKNFFDALSSRGFRVRSATVAYSMAGGDRSPLERRTGKQLVSMLKDPVILSGGSPPEAWMKMDRIARLLLIEEFAAALDTVEAVEGDLQADPDFRALEAVARLRAGQAERALEIAAELCRADPMECHLLAYLGKEQASGPDRGGETLKKTGREESRDGKTGGR